MAADPIVFEQPLQDRLLDVLVVAVEADECLTWAEMDAVMAAVKIYEDPHEQLRRLNRRTAIYDSLCDMDDQRVVENSPGWAKKHGEAWLARRRTERKRAKFLSESGRPPQREPFEVLEGGEQ